MLLSTLQRWYVPGLTQIASHSEYIDSLLRSLTSLPALAPYARESRPRFRRFGDVGMYPVAEELIPIPPPGTFAGPDASGSRRSRKMAPPTPTSSRTREREMQEASRNAKKRKAVPPQTVSSKGRAVIQEPASHDRATRVPGAPMGTMEAKRRMDGSFRRSGWQEENESDDASETYENGARFARANRVRARGPHDMDVHDAWGRRMGPDGLYDGTSDARGAPRGRPGKASVGSNRDDTDDQRYCFCNNVSYGDMIGCDDDDCEREWFHLGCVGLSKPPQGTWYCDACLERRAQQARSKAKRGGSRPARPAPTEAVSASRRVPTGRR